ncbi:MAG: hypothetical protein ACREMB_20815, partial [Candidatus Rokuibacteriota bacterium]
VHRITYQGGSFAVEVSPTGRPETMLTVVVPEPLTVGVGATMSLGIRDGWVIPEASPTAPEEVGREP